ncbi:MAG: alpha/beta hydrolase [Nanoarchaeota archaeon]|nr:alpha/beta hydrolase [Nanoarchaeota archaeon]
MDFIENKFYRGAVTCNYIICGKGKPLLFLHGGGTEARTYPEIIGLLSQSYKVIAPDLPGFGRSSMPEGIWSFDDYSEFVGALLSHLKIKSAIVVGYSFGAGVAVSLASRSRKVKSIILLSPPMATGRHVDKKWIMHTVISEAARNILLIRSMRQARMFFRVAADFISNVVQRRHNLQSLQDSVIKCLNGCELRMPEDIPTQVIISREDRIFFSQDIENALRNRCETNLTYTDGPHLWVALYPEKAVNLLNFA